MEKEHEKRLRLEKSAMGTAFESGIGWIICPQMNRYPEIAATTKEIFIEHMAELQEILDSDQYRFLLQAVERIDAAVCKEDDEAADTRPFIREWLWVLSRSEYSECFEHVQEWHTLLNQETYELFVILGMDSGSYESTDLIYDWDDEPLILKGDLPTEYYISYGEKRILAAIMGIDSMGNAKIVQGYGKSKEYVGHYKNWKFHGEGCEYDWKGEKYREGIFYEGKLQKGIEYNWLIKVEDGKYTKYFQCGKQLNLTMMIEEEIEYEGQEKYFISDFKVDGDIEWEINRRPLAYK